jgi:hypothetical protein
MTNHSTWWILTVSTIPNYAQTTSSILTTVNSYLDGWKTTSLNKPQAKLNIIKMEDLYDSQDCRAMQIYPDTIPNPKGIK